MDFNEIMSKIFNEAVETEVEKRLKNRRSHIDVDIKRLEFDAENWYAMTDIVREYNRSCHRNDVYSWFCNEFKEELKQDYIEINSFTRSDIPDEMIVDIKEEAIEELDRDDYLRIMNDRIEVDDFTYIVRNYDFYDGENVKNLIMQLLAKI